MSFNGSEGGEIPLGEGAKMTSEYRSQNPNQTIAHFFGKDIINQILKQEGCMGIRMYYGIDAEGKKQLVIVGADASKNDMLELVADLSFPCPIGCGNHNVLNS